VQRAKGGGTKKTGTEIWTDTKADQALWLVIPRAEGEIEGHKGEKEGAYRGRKESKGGREEEGRRVLKKGEIPRMAKMLEGSIIER